MLLPAALLAPLLLPAALLAQDSSPPLPSPSTSPSLSLSLTTAAATVTVATTVSGRPTQVITVLPSAVFNVTHTVAPPSISASSTSTPSASASPDPTRSCSSDSPALNPFPLLILFSFQATTIDPAFAVLGVLLMLTGLPSAFWGHKNRWTSFFLIGFYTLSLVCIVLILKFGVMRAVNPPSRTLRGMFVLASAIAGIAGGAIAIFFWKGARYGIGAWGGFAFALWIQSFANGGVIRPIGYRWILYIACGVIGFTLSTIPRIHYHVLLISTAIVGATSFILGVDCFTTAGLKEFYMWNLGFPGLFPRFVELGIQFPVTETMQIELGLIAAVALMGIAVQLRILKVLQRKMKEIAEEAKVQDEEAEAQAAGRYDELDKERAEWEKDRLTHGRQESNLSSFPLLGKDREASGSPALADDARHRTASGLSDFKVAPTSDEDINRATRHGRSSVALPTLDLGLGIQDDVPRSFMANNTNNTDYGVQISSAELEDFKRKQELLAEIQTIRRSIDVLKSESPAPPSSSERSRQVSMISRRTTSMDASNALLQSNPHARPPRQVDPRARSYSMDLRHLSPDEPVSRPSSVPLRDDWDTYIQERKLLQPPSGISQPIATTAPPTDGFARTPLPPAVQEAMQRRRERESSLFGVSPGSSGSSDDAPLARIVQQQKTNNPVTILPPRRTSTNIIAPVPQTASRTRTFEELNERHREKMRDMQAPLTQAEKEHAELEAAKQRWERSKALEKDAVMRRQAEKAAALGKRKKGDAEGSHGKGAETGKHLRSLSADKLGNHGRTASSSKRLSTLKVEDWQRYQQDAETGGGRKRNARPEGVPFPNEHGQRKSRDMA